MNNLKSQTEDKLQSKVIDFLRFPLIIGVLFIHNVASTVNISGMTFGNQKNILGYYVLTTLFSQILGRVAVPLFFFVSGFLFFLHIDNFNNSVYLKKLKSRVNTLLIPYIFWNISLLILLYLISLNPSLNAFLNKAPKLDLNYIIRSLWDENGGMPISYQFWFIRDLMVTVLLTPLLYFCVKHLKLLGVLLLSVCWYCDWWFQLPGLSIAAIFFFTSGAWFSINKRNLVVDIKKFGLMSFILYPLIVIIDLVTKKYYGNIYVHKVGILFGIIFWFNIACFLLTNNKVKLNNFLVQSSFFVFAFHEPLLTIIKKVIFVIFKPENEMLLTILYFVIVLIVVFVCLLVYFFLQRLAPKFCRIVTGGR